MSVPFLDTWLWFSSDDQLIHSYSRPSVEPVLDRAQASSCSLCTDAAWLTVEELGFWQRRDEGHGTSGVSPHSKGRGDAVSGQTSCTQVDAGDNVDVITDVPKGLVLFHRTETQLHSSWKVLKWETLCHQTYSILVYYWLLCSVSIKVSSVIQLL